MIKNVLIVAIALLGLALEGKSQEDDGRKVLGNNRFVRVHEYQGRILVDIREYYPSKDGKLGPGKRGIALSPEQWTELKKYIGQIDAEVDHLLKTVPQNPQQQQQQQQQPGGGPGQNLPF